MAVGAGTAVATAEIMGATASSTAVATAAGLVVGAAAAAGVTIGASTTGGVGEAEGVAGAEESALLSVPRTARILMICFFVGGKGRREGGRGGKWVRGDGVIGSGV